MRERSPRIPSSAWPSTIAVSSAVWWPPVCRSPLTLTSRSIRPWRASRSSMWSKKPTPVSRAPAPVPLEPLRPRDRSTRLRQLRHRLGADAHLRHPATEVARRQRRGEASRAAGGQHVVGAGDVIAERGGAGGPYEQAAGRADLGRERLHVLAHQLQ